MDVMQEGGAVLPQAVDEAAGQGAGELDELIRVEERSHCGVKTGKKKMETWDLLSKYIMNKYYYTLYHTFSRSSSDNHTHSTVPVESRFTMRPNGSLDSSTE